MWVVIFFILDRSFLSFSAFTFDFAEIDKVRLALLGEFLMNLRTKAQNIGPSFDPFIPLPNSPVLNAPIKSILLPYIPHCPDETLLIIRPEYEALFDLNLRQYERCLSLKKSGGSIVIGNPGIGKSVGCLTYHLIRAAMLGIPVALELHDNEQSIYFDHILPPTLIPFRRPLNILSAQTMLLIDTAGHQDAKEPLRVSSFTIVFASPNVAHYHSFRKRNRVARHFLPVWKLDELEAVRPLVSSIDADVLKRFSFPLVRSFLPSVIESMVRRFNIVGGLFRHLFDEASFESGKEMVLEAVSRLSPLILELHFSERLLQIEDFAGFPHSLLHCLAVELRHGLEDSRYVIKTVGAASQFAHELILKKVQLMPKLQYQISAFLASNPDYLEKAFFNYLSDTHSPSLPFMSTSMHLKGSALIDLPCSLVNGGSVAFCCSHLSYSLTTEPSLSRVVAFRPLPILMSVLTCHPAFIDHSEKPNQQ